MKIILFKFYLFRRMAFTYHYLKCKLTFIPKINIYFHILISTITVIYYLLFLDRELKLFKYFSLL